MDSPTGAAYPPSPSMEAPPPGSPEARERELHAAETPAPQGEGICWRSFFGDDPGADPAGAARHDDDGASPAGRGRGRPAWRLAIPPLPELAELGRLLVCVTPPASPPPGSGEGSPGAARKAVRFAAGPEVFTFFGGRGGRPSGHGEDRGADSDEGCPRAPLLGAGGADLGEMREVRGPRDVDAQE